MFRRMTLSLVVGITLCLCAAAAWAAPLGPGDALSIRGGEIGGLPGFSKSGLPPNVIVAPASGQVTVFERKGQAGKVLIRAGVPGAQGSGSLVADDGAVAYTGDAAALAKEGFSLQLKLYECVRLAWKPAAS